MRYDFHNLKTGKVISYTSVVNGAAYCSLHKCNNMTDAQAKNNFHREHKKEVLTLIQQKLTNDETNSAKYAS